MCFAKCWPFYLRHQKFYIPGMHLGYVQWKKTTWFIQESCSLYLISIYFDYLLGLNKIPCLLYEQIFIYTTMWFKSNILLGSILSLSVVYGHSSSRIWGGATGSDRKWPEVTWPEEALFGSMLCACATGTCAISALVGPFHRKWQSHVTGRFPVRSYYFFPYFFFLYFSPVLFS